MVHQYHFLLKLLWVWVRPVCSIVCPEWRGTCWLSKVEENVNPPIQPSWLRKIHKGPQVLQGVPKVRSSIRGRWMAQVQKHYIFWTPNLVLVWIPYTLFHTTTLKLSRNCTTSQRFRNLEWNHEAHPRNEKSSNTILLRIFPNQILEKIWFPLISQMLAIYIIFVWKSDFLPLLMNHYDLTLNKTRWHICNHQETAPVSRWEGSDTWIWCCA